MIDALRLLWFVLCEDGSGSSWILAGFVTGAMGLLLALAWRKRAALKGILRAPDADRPCLIRSFAATERGSRWLKRALRRRFDTDLGPEARRAALTGLLAMEPDGGLEALRLCERGLADPAIEVRRAAVDSLRGSATDDPLDLLQRHLSSESNPELAAAIRAILAAQEKRMLSEALQREDFDESEAICRRVMSRNPDDRRIPVVLENLQAMRRNRAERIQQRNRERTEAKTASIRQSAGIALARGRCEDAEALIRQALEENPNDKESRRFLENLPAVRRAFDADFASRCQSDLFRAVQRRRKAAFEALDAQDYDSAEERLRSLAGVAPDDTWAVRALEGLAQLREERRTALVRSAAFERSKRTAELERQVEEQAGRGNLDAAGSTLAELAMLKPEDARWGAMAERIAEMKSRREADEAIARAEQAVQEGRIEEAGKEVERLLARDPSLKRIKLLQQRLPRLCEARRQRAMREAKEREEAHLAELRQSAEEHFAEDRLDDAFEASTRILAVQPDNPYGIAMVDRIESMRRQRIRCKARAEAQALLNRGAYDDAELAASALLGEEEGLQAGKELLEAIGLARRLAQGRQERAQEQERQSRIRALRESSVKLLEKGDLDAASAKVREWSELSPEDSRARAVATQCREMAEAFQALSENDLEKAETHARRLQELTPNAKSCRELLSQIREIKRAKETRERNRREAENRRAFESGLRQAQTCLDQGLHDQSVEHAKQALRLRPGEDRALDMLEHAIVEREKANARPPIDEYGDLIRA